MRSDHRGYTLIELMVAVAIVGILAAVALPTFDLLKIRVRHAERTVVMKGLEQSMLAFLLDHENRFPESCGTDCSLYSPQFTNPPWPADGQLLPFNHNAPGWAKVDFPHYSGGLYYRYHVSGLQSGATRTFSVSAYGIELNGSLIKTTATFTYETGHWSQTSFTEEVMP